MKRLFYIYCFFFTSIMYSQETNFYKIAFETQQTLTKLSELVYPMKHIPLINSYNELDKSSTRLFDLLTDLVDQDEYINTIYLNTLSDAQKALENCTKENKSTEELLTILSKVQKDYKVKLKSFSYGIKPGLDCKIKVVVKTVTSKGYHPYAQYSYDDDYVKRFTFNNPTNNSETYLAPGYYRIWIKKGNYKSELRDVEIFSSDENNIFYFEK
ncbi:hypothetical protein [Tenacibaculum xiamenense]|uniref:hypothetical protein n=1 Tax=Tenacibaculum xiamenense TaxID=1261553 RepID=UPI003895C0EF